MSTEFIQDPLVGLAINPGVRDLVMPSAEELRALGPKWIRYLLNRQFQNFQSGQNAELDWVLDCFKDLGVNVLVLINPETLPDNLPSGNPPPHGAGWGDANSGYIGFVSDLAQKIAAFYRGKIHAIEVFNEPDIQKIVPEDYGALLAATCPKIKAVNNLPVILAGICCGENYEYLRRVVQAAPGAFDGVGWHPYAERVDGYPWPTWGFGELRNSLTRARAIGGKPLWVTEIGALLEYNWGEGAAPAESVAEYLKRAFNLMRSLGADTVATAFWFTYKIPWEGWGLVDDAGNHRPAWYAFQQQARAPAAPPAITNVTFAPTTLDIGQLLNVSITVKNNSNAPLPTQSPPPGTVYEEDESFVSRGFGEVNGAFRVGVDFDGRMGIDHPYRWGLGAPLAPGQTTTINGAIRLKSAQARNFWSGLVREQIAWVQDRQGVQLVTAKAGQVPPIGTEPRILSVTFAPTTLDAGQVLNVSITVRNDSNVPLVTQEPNPGFTYNEGETFLSKGFGETAGAIRVGVDFDGRAGVDHPYRWGLGAPLAPGQTAVVNGAIRLNNAAARNYWAGLVREQIAWLQDNQGKRIITVNVPAGPPPVLGQPTITAVTFAPTTIEQGQVVQISVTVKNTTNAPLATQGPDPGFTYNEGDNFLTKGHLPAAGAYRVGVDFDGRAGVDHPYRWGLGAPLAPGQSVVVAGYIRLNRRQTTRFWVGLIQEPGQWLQDQQGATALTVVKA